MRNLLFLHGMPNTSKSIKPIIDSLSVKYNVINFDWMSNDKTMKQMTYDISEKIKHIDSLSIFGMDWGGIVGPRVAFQNSDKNIENIILCNCGLPYSKGCEYVFEGKPMEYHIKPTSIEEFEYSLHNLENGSAFKNFVSYVQTTDSIDIEKIVDILTYYNHDIEKDDYEIHKNLPLQMDKELDISDLVKKYIDNFENFYYIGSKKCPISSEGVKSFSFAKQIFLIDDASHLLTLDQPKELIKIIDHIML